MPAERYLCACLAHCLNPAQPLPAFPGDLNEQVLFELACRHRLTGLLYTLGQAQPRLWPASFQAALGSARYRILLHGDWCAGQVKLVLTDLVEAGIAVIVLKGWARISTTYHGDISQRIYDDVDLLVMPNEAGQAEAVLQNLGYQPTLLEPWPGYRWRYQSTWTYRQSITTHSAARFFTVGLHWGLLNSPFYDRHVSVSALFDRARLGPVVGVQVRRLAAEDALVYACGHLAVHHQYGGELFRYYEMAASILQPGPALDWDVVLERAVDWRLTIPTRRVLSYLNNLWPGLLPSWIPEQLETLPTTPSERLVHSLLLSNERNNLVRAAVQWAALPGFGRRALHLLETAFPSPAYMQQRYGPPPGGLWPVLYLRRAARTASWMVSTRLSVRE